ncbi:DNA-processing protein DprA [Patescibacteria group bacterium]
MSSLNHEKKYDYEKYCAHILNTHPAIGSRTLIKLYEHFGSFSIAWQNIKQNKFDIFNQNPKLIEIFKHINIYKAEQSLIKLEKYNIKMLLFADSSYPKLLNEIPDKPAILYYRGDICMANKPNIAVVGTRKMSVYGKNITETIVRDLIKSNITITSGLAMGIDACAHTNALHSGGNTIAVCAGGIDDPSIYPKINYALAQKIIKNNGLLLSENPPETEILKYMFPIRNRIIAGLSLGTLVVEASENSGALHTARASLDYNREVFAIPGDIHKPNSAGPNRLIKMGAKLVTSTNDILEELGINTTTENNINTTEIKLTEQEKMIFSTVNSENPLHIDKIVSSSKLNTSLVNSTLILLEIKGLIKNVGNNYYIKNIRNQ